MIMNKGLNEQKTKSILVTSFKPGTGKSFIAMHLAMLLGQKSTSLYLDLSVPFGYLTSWLSIENSLKLDTISPLLTNPDSKTAKRIENAILETNQGFDAILGTNSMDFSGLDYTQNTNLLANITNYEYIVQDHKTILNKDDLKLLNEFDKVIVVLEPDPTCIYNTYQFLKFIRENAGKDGFVKSEILSKFLFVFNKLDDTCKVKIKDVEKELNIKICGKIVSDKEAIDSFSSKFKPIDDKDLIIYEDLMNLTTVVANSFSQKVI